MADNVTQYYPPDATVEGATFAFDEPTSGVASGVKVARSKTGFGTDGSYEDVSSTNPLPTQIFVGATAVGAANPVPGSNAAASQVDGHSATLGAKADAAASADDSTATFISLFKRFLSRLTTFMGQLPAALTASGNLKVSLQESNAAQAVTGTFYQATQPVSAASLPLPSGAATAAKQPALGTAGTASADVLSVQGVASMTALKVDASATTQPISVASLPLPSGASTAANQATTNTALAAIQAAVEILDNAVAGNEFQVDVLTMPSITVGASALPTGAATAAKQPALGTAGTASTDVLTVQGIASMTALKVDGSAVTQPVSAASLPLPSGASTAAKQPALGTAGTASADVITVQGAALMTALKVDGSAVTQPVSDGGGSLTVDGTVAVSGIVTVTGGLTDTQLRASAVPVSLATVPSHAVTNAGTFAVQVTSSASHAVTGPLTDTELRASAVPVSLAAVPSHDVTNIGTFAVQLSAALPAGTNGIGKLTANSGVDIGDVDVTSVAPGTGASSLGKAEDAAHTSADVGVFVLAVRADTAASTAGTDGDYAGLIVDSAGRLWCNVSNTVTVASHAVTNAGTFAVQATQAGGWTVTGAGGTFPVTDSGGSLTVDNGGTFAVQATIAAGAATIGKAEDVASADADVGVPAMAVRKAAPANVSGTDGDYEFLQMSAGRLWCSATVDAALPAGTNAIGKLAANAGVTIGAVEIAAAQTLATVTTVTTVSTVTNLSQMGGVAIALNAGTVSTGTQRVAQATGATATLANVSGSASSVTLLAANTGRLKAIIFNDSASVLYVKFGTTASATDYTYKLLAGQTLEETRYNGRMDGIWVSATGAARVTEVAA